MIYLKDLLPEIEFASQEEFQAYNAKHKMRKTTKVKIAGKDTTAGDAAGATKKPKQKFPPKPGIDIPYKKDSIQATQGAQKGPQSPEDAIGTDPAKERAIIAGIKDLVKTGKDVDLCGVSVPGSNLFCGGNKGIPRKEMPQLKSKPIPGGPADKLVKQGKLQLDDGGEVNTEELFLKSIGKEAKVEKVNVSNLKATQNQIVGKKVSMFLNQLLNGSPDDGFTKALNEPIIVSEDGYVVDGHHRWAALVAMDLANGGSGDVEMNVKRVEMGIEPLIQKSNDYTKKMGLEVKNAEKKKEESFTKEWWKKNLIEHIVTKTVLKPRRKELLLMGGAYGHMAHPFDDKDLTFGDLKKIIEYGLGGTLNREDNVTEKLDGQNIMVSWKDGKLIAARNKGHIKNAGATALDAKAVASKFAGRGDIRNAFVYAMTDLGKSIGSLSDKQKVKIFDNGHNFMNLEVMWPKSANVVDYDLASLVFHGALKYNDVGAVKGEVKGSGRILAGMIKQVNQHIQKHYSIGKPKFLTLSKHTDFGKLKSKFLSSLTRYQSKFGLKDSDTLGLYHQKWWEQFIIKKSKGSLSAKVLKGLVKRWAFFDKSYAVKDIRNDIKDEKILDWVLSFDKNDHAKQVKLNMKPFETLFFEVGAEIMKNISDWMAVNPDSTVQRMKKKLDGAISSVRKGGDLKKLNTLKAQLDKLQAIGGVDAIVPSEGIVFKYNGKTYKFTGAFAPINQITGLISF